MVYLIYLSQNNPNNLKVIGFCNFNQLKEITKKPLLNVCPFVPQNMFSYAVKHHSKRATMNIENHANLTPLTLASKLGRHAIFKEIIELQSFVS